jgi:sugar fermentation stimulation protein A
MVAAGARAVMLYLVQRGDCDHFRIAEDIDPAYAAALVTARARGVETLCYECDMRLDGIDVAGALPLEL